MVKDPSRAETGELDWIATIAASLREGAPGEVGIGDDTAVIATPDASHLLFSSDVVVDGVHFDRAISSAADIGWKAMAVNLSDVAAMGGVPKAAVVSIVAAGSVDLEGLYAGLVGVGKRFGCSVVGGDCSSGETLAVSIAVLGVAPPSGAVLRSGAEVGDVVFVTGALGRSAAGMRALRSDPTASGPNVDAHRRPMPRLSEGQAVAAAGAHAMMDLSDGLGIDCSRLALSSGIGIALDRVPIASGATLDDALGGGEDYELLFTAPDNGAVEAAFEEAGLPAPLRIGEVVSADRGLTLDGEELPPTGYEHR